MTGCNTALCKVVHVRSQILTIEQTVQHLLTLHVDNQLAEHLPRMVQVHHMSGEAMDQPCTWLAKIHVPSWSCNYVQYATTAIFAHTVGSLHTRVLCKLVVHVQSCSTDKNQ
jgi:hypothetical protein